MKISVPLLSLALALGAISCGGTTPPPESNGNPIQQGDGGNPPSTADAGGSHNPNGGRLEGETPPSDAEFTLFCKVVRGPTHVLAATHLKDQLIAGSGLKAWHIIHGDDQSMVFYGYYRTFDDKDHNPAEVVRAQADLHRIEALKDGQGDRLFPSPMFLPISQPDPDAPPQWDLVKTPQTAFWSLQIAAYQGSPERKRYAVEAVRGLRATGVEAYYYHGETISSVCVGAWPRTAIKEQDSADAKTADEHGTLLVIGGGQQLPPRVSSEMRDREGNKLTIEAAKLEVLDPTLAKAIRDYPEHAVNGDVYVRTLKDGQKVASPSFIVLVPHADTSVPVPQITLHNDAAGADQATNNILDNPTGAPSPYGRLHSVDQP